MAFMMPVVKKNYNIYAAESATGGERVRKSSNSSQASSASTPRRRKTQSECPSLSSSPPTHGPGSFPPPVIYRVPVPLSRTDSHGSAVSGRGSVPAHPTTAPIPMRRGRASAPVLGASFHSPFSRNNSLPDAPKPPPSPTRSESSTSSTEQQNHKFSIKWLNRLRKSFRKDVKAAS